MTNKQTEERIAQLEKKVIDLQSQLLTLSLRTPSVYITPPSVPMTAPVVPYTFQSPYSGSVPGVFYSNSSNTSLSPVTQREQNL